MTAPNFIFPSVSFWRNYSYSPRRRRRKEPTRSLSRSRPPATKSQWDHFSPARFILPTWRENNSKQRVLFSRHLDMWKGQQASVWNKRTRLQHRIKSWCLEKKNAFYSRANILKKAVRCQSYYLLAECQIWRIKCNLNQRSGRPLFPLSRPSFYARERFVRSCFTLLLRTAVRFYALCNFSVHN